MDAADDVQHPSRLLQLPREIRDLIYDYVLVRCIIPIECAIARRPKIREPLRRRSSTSVSVESITTTYPLRSPWIHRRAWIMPAFDTDLDYYMDDDRPLPATVDMTYQIANEIEDDTQSNIDLCLMQVCRQIYAESSKVFYSNNIFSFTSDFRIPTAFAFLCDRPAVSLLNIHSLELALMEDNNMRGTTQAHYPVVRRSSDSLVLQYAYHYFPELCTLLSTSRINLRTLYLTIETYCSRSAPGPVNLEDYLPWEQQHVAHSWPWIPIWFDPLLRIKGLVTLEICWISNQPCIQRMANVMGTMKQHMSGDTQSADKLPRVSAQTNDSSKFTFRSLRRYLLDPGDANAALQWDDFVMEGEHLTMTESRIGTEVDDVRICGYRPHLKEILGDLGGPYIFWCNLKSF